MGNYPSGTYEFQFTGTSGTKSDSVIFKMNLRNICEVVGIVLGPFPFYDDTYWLGDEEQW